MIMGLRAGVLALFKGRGSKHNKCSSRGREVSSENDLLMLSRLGRFKEHLLHSSGVFDQPGSRVHDKDARRKLVRLTKDLMSKRFMAEL